MNLHIRAATIDGVSKDVDTLAALHTEYGSEPVTTARLLEWQSSAPVGRVLHQVIIDSGAGFADTFRDPNHPAGEFLARVLVTQSQGRRGLGCRLLADIEDFARQHGAHKLCLMVQESCRAGIAFAEKHGYLVYQRLYESTLDPQSVEPRLLDKPAPAGIDVLDFAEWGDTASHRRLIWELHSRADSDEPGNDDDPMPYESFDKQLFSQQDFRPERLLLARADGQLIGVARLDYRPLTNSLYHSGVVVDREFRGRGVASALKRTTIRYASRIGAAYLRTHNDSRNLPMLAINRRYGYVPAPGRLWVARGL